MRRTAVVCVAFWLVSGLFLGIGAIAANPSGVEAEAGFVDRIGRERSAGGLGGYVVAADLVDVARRHAEEMRRQQRLHHNPNLGDDVSGWQAVGENVGVGPTVETIHEKLMASPSHRDNILSGRFTEVGVGVVVDGADLWVVQVFRLPASAPAAASSPEPAAPADQPPASSSDTPAPAPEPRPAPPAAPASGSGTVRTAANARPVAAAVAPTTAPEPPAPPTTVAAPEVIPATEAPVPDAEPAAPVVAEPPAADPASTVLDTDLRSTTTAAERQVTWPVAIASTMLVGVVAALTFHVASSKVPARVTAGRRRSLLDVWELAVAG